MKVGFCHSSLLTISAVLCALIICANARADDVILYNNGQFVTAIGVCPDGADASQLQSNLGLSTFGFGTQHTLNNRMADDFTADEIWRISTITFFAYQTGSGLASTMSGVYVRIWNGSPTDDTSTVIFGNLESNLFASTQFANAYRVSFTNFHQIDRPIMSVVAEIDTIIAPGTYWVDWSIDGSLASGPWTPPITIPGQTNTGNALQYITSWSPLRDTGNSAPQGVPFIVTGYVVPEPMLGAMGLLALLAACRAFRA